VRGDGGQELAQRQRDYQAVVVGARNVLILSNAPQVEERSAVQRDAAQLDQSHRHRERKFVQDHLANHVVARGDHVPEEAHQQHNGYVP